MLIKFQNRQCLLDESLHIRDKGPSTWACPYCGSAIDRDGRVPTTYRNEGGLQEDLDIWPNLAEEAHLEEHPEERPARAFQALCAAGDIAEILQLFNNHEENSDEGDMSIGEILRYQDPVRGPTWSKTALHLAIEKDQQHVAWLLIYLCVDLPITAFPDSFVTVARLAGVEGVKAKYAEGVDIRSIEDCEYRKPAYYGQNTLTRPEDWVFTAPR